MYCRNCGSEIAEGSKFCNHCGSPVEVLAQPEIQQPSVHNETTPHTMSEGVSRRPQFAEFQWNITDYPNRNAVEKTEDVDFDWNADPNDIFDAPKAAAPAASPVIRDVMEAPETFAASAAPMESPEVLSGADLETAIFGKAQQEKSPEEMSAAERIDKFYTFNRKNEEFQRLINSEFERVKSGNAIKHELSEADKIAAQKFESRPEDPSMEKFFAREGIVKPYQPKEFQSDVLQKIDAQEAEKEAKRLEEEARLKAMEEARLEAEAKKRAEEEAARLEAIAKQKAEEEARAAEEARLKAEEEARLRAEEEARRRVEEEARLRAEAEAKVKAAEEARLKAEADLRAAQEAAKIRAQQEARLAAEAEAQLKAEQEKKRMEAEEAQRQLEAKRKRLAEEANKAVAEEEVRKVLEQTARMRQEEEAKIKAAVAGLRSGAEAAPAINREVEEAHRATRDQINEMARARDAYFADAAEWDSFQPKAKTPVTGRNTMLSSDEIAKTRVIDKAAIIAGLNEATRVASVKPEPTPQTDEEFFNSLDAAAASAQQTEGMAAQASADSQMPVQDHEPQPIDFKQETPVNDLDDLLSQFEAVNNMGGPEPYEAPAPQPQVQESKPFVSKPGLDDTVLMEQSSTMMNNIPLNDFDSYGNEEAANYINQQNLQRQQAEANVSASQEETQNANAKAEEKLSRKELKQRAKEQKRLEKERALEEKATRKKEKQNYIEPDVEKAAPANVDADESGGKGRIVLKVILAILIVILVVEVVGMGIRFLAPQSPAAEFIDTQLNKIVQMITGDEAEEQRWELNA